MRRYLFVGGCIILFTLIVLLDVKYAWPPATDEDILIMIAFITILFTLNYALSIRIIQFNIFKDYRNLITVPLVPRQFFLKELIIYLKAPHNLLLFLSSYFFFSYFLRQSELSCLFNYTSSFFLYYVFLSFNLIVIRFLCGHNSKGTNTFFIICLLINSCVMYQIILADGYMENLYSSIIVKYNPLNTLFFLPVTNDSNLLYLTISYLIFSIIVYPLLRMMSWERQLAYT